MSMKKNEKTVARPYGGSRCHGCVRQRYATLRCAGGSSCFTSATALNSLLTSPPRFLLHLSIVRAFLIEEQKIVKRMVKNQPAAAAATAAAPAKKATKAAKK
jgi:hypothetical protein